MSFTYLPPPASGELRQGEILGGFREFSPILPASSGIQPSEILPIDHPYVVVMTADCDLLRDWNARIQPNWDVQNQRGHPQALLSVLLCEAFQEDEITVRQSGRDIWKRVQQNQDERYHRLEGAQIGDSPTSTPVPTLYLDFKKSLAVPPGHIHGALQFFGTQRTALIPPIYLHDLMHRFYAFLGRVALPDG